MVLYASQIEYVGIVMTLVLPSYANIISFKLELSENLLAF